MSTELAMIPAAKPLIGREERDAVDRVLASGMVAQGPEVAAFEEEFSAALAGGPGLGPLLAAAGAWSSLSLEYAAIAEALRALLGATQASWQGPSAERYVASHGPYLGWLATVSTDSAAMAIVAATRVL